MCNYWISEMYDDHFAILDLLFVYYQVLNVSLLKCMFFFYSVLKGSLTAGDLLIYLSKQSDDEEKDGEEGDNKGTPKGRKKIRRIIVDEHLRSETQRALKEEEERRRRLAEREQREDFREVHYTQLTLSMHCRIHALSEMSY